MPRFTGKTYSRTTKDKAAESAKVFDDVIGSKVTGAKSRWGATSFTSTRGTIESDVRKRKIQDVDLTAGCADDDGEDPFSFDNEDNGPSQPKRGMGFKVDAKTKGSGKTGGQRGRGSKLKKDENNDEKDTMRQAPTKTYSKNRIQPSQSADNSKQPSIEKFTTKLSANKNNSDKVFRITLKSGGCKTSADNVRKPSETRPVAPPPKKFFLSSSSQNNRVSCVEDGQQSDQAASQNKERRELFQSTSDFEYDSDELANLDSGDPEIIFNSPQKRRREAEKQHHHGDENMEEEDDEGIFIKQKNAVKSNLFADSNSRGSSAVAKQTSAGTESQGKRPTASELFDKAIKSSIQIAKNIRESRSPKKNQLSASELFDVAIKKTSRASVRKDKGTSMVPVNKVVNAEEDKNKVQALSASELFDAAFKSGSTDRESPAEGEEQESPSLSASELFDIAIKNSNSAKSDAETTAPKKKQSSSDVSRLLSNVVLKSKSQSFSGEVKKKESNVSELLSNVVLKTKNCGDEEKQSESNAAELFDKVVKRKRETDDVNHNAGSKRVWRPLSANAFDDTDEEEEESASQSTHDGSSQNTGKTQRSNLTTDSDGDSNDTDVISSPLKSGKARGSQYTQRRAASSASPFTELKRSVSVESGGSGCSASGDRLKKGGSLGNKLLSLEIERNRKKEPIVRRLLTSPKKGAKMLKYNARAWHDDEEGHTAEGSSQGSVGGAGGVFDSPFEEDTGSKSLDKPPNMRRQLKKAPTAYDDAVTAVKVNREHKQLFTVVRQVKQAHECHEHGENQDFNDELEYIMDGLNEEQATSVRCLSCLNMTTKCVQPSFRMHLRAHGTFDKVFSALHDAYQYPSLALCTASVLYLLSRDRFSIDLEQSTLTLMLRLLSVDSQQQSPFKNNAVNREYQTVQSKLRDIFSTIKADKKSNNPHLDLHSITTGHLTMESLLSLTSKKAGDWFKEELRVLGGLDHIIKTVSDCTDSFDEVSTEPSEAVLDQLRKIERCLRVLENVTYMNSENQNYLVSHKSCLLVTSLHKTMNMCETCLTFNPLEEVGGRVNKECVGYLLWSALLAVLRVLLNLTHDNAYTSTKVGQRDGLMRKVMMCLLRMPQFVPHEQRFDLLVLGLGLLINMVEHCEHNRDILIDTKSVCPFDETSPISKLAEPMGSLESITKLFMLRYEAAKRIEVEHDEELEERERLQQERAVRASKVGINGATITGPSTQAANQSGQWKLSDSGLEWVVLEESEEERIEKELQHDSDSDMDVEVMPNSSQDEEENFTKALHKAGRHMEDCILAAYVALLLGCTIQGNMDHIERVRDCLPEGDFEPMIRMLRKFLGFMNFTATSAVSQSSGSKSISRIIEVLEAC